MSDLNAEQLIGRLALADAMLGDAIWEMRDVLAHANWPGPIRRPRTGDTTGRAAERLQTELGHEAALATSLLLSWIAAAKDVVDQRNRVVHAIALNQCLNCGEATLFRHPASGEDVDRSPDTLRAVLDRYRALQEQWLALATELTVAVNRRIYVEAKKIADATDEIQSPPQVYPKHVEHLCTTCSENGRGETTVHIGAALAVIPTARWDEFRAGTWPA